MFSNNNKNFKKHPVMLYVCFSFYSVSFCFMNCAALLLLHMYLRLLSLHGRLILSLVCNFSLCTNFFHSEIYFIWCLYSHFYFLLLPLAKYSSRSHWFYLVSQMSELLDNSICISRVSFNLPFYSFGEVILSFVVVVYYCYLIF